MKGIGGLRSHEKGTWKHFITPSPCTFTVQRNDLHHWAPKQPASVSRQGWLKITLWNDIKLVKHFSAYGIVQGVPYFTPAANFSPLLSSFLQFSWGKSSIEPLQVRLKTLSQEDGKDHLVWSPTYRSSSVPLSQGQARNVFLSFRKHAQFLLLRLSPCQVLLQISQTESYRTVSQTVFWVTVPRRSGAFGLPCQHCRVSAANIEKGKTTHREAVNQTKNTS